jgi:hypothetical protein
MPGNINLLKSTLNADFKTIFEEGSNDSTIMAQKLSDAIGNRLEAFLNTVKVAPGITLTATGTGNLALPVSSTGATTSQGSLV